MTNEPKHNIPKVGALCRGAMTRVEGPSGMSLNRQPAGLETRRAEFERVLECLRIGAEVGGSVSTAKSKNRLWISFLEGERGAEAWVANLMADLKLAGFHPLAVPRSVSAESRNSTPSQEEIAGCDHVLVVCTPSYLRRQSGQISGVSDEMQTLQQWALTERNAVIPLLLKGSRATSVPVFLRHHDEFDFRQVARYHEQALALFLTLLGRNRWDPAFQKWMEPFASVSSTGPDSSEGVDSEAAFDQQKMRNALQRIGIKAAEAAAQVGQPVTVWRNGEVICDAPGNLGQVGG